MLYLIAASWEWVAGAAALGLVVGALAVATEKDARFSGHGIVVTSALLLVGGFFLSNVQIIPGRAGLYFDFGLLLAGAYGLALPIGGGARLLAGAGSPPAPAKKKPPHVVVRGAPKPRPEPEFEPAPPDAAEPASAALAAPEAAEPSPPPETAATEASAAEPRPAPAAAETPKKHPGAQPEGLPGPRGGKPDDLSKIKGVGPKSVEKLHALGVYHFDQIAAWTPENVKWVSASFAIPGRLERGRWVAQAKELAEAARPQEPRPGEKP
jgi:predicted flap endonuclease-1-like 5' DNA nuclease